MADTHLSQPGDQINRSCERETFAQASESFTLGRSPLSPRPPELSLEITARNLTAFSRRTTPDIHANWVVRVYGPSTALPPIPKWDVCEMSRVKMELEKSVATYLSEENKKVRHRAWNPSVRLGLARDAALNKFRQGDPSLEGIHVASRVESEGFDGDTMTGGGSSKVGPDYQTVYTDYPATAFPQYRVLHAKDVKQRMPEEWVNGTDVATASHRSNGSQYLTSSTLGSTENTERGAVKV